MARPKIKKDLIEASNTNFKKLWELIGSFSEKELETEFDFLANPKLKETHWKRDKNIKDVLIHLYEWHQLLILWITENLEGKNSAFLPYPYNWKTYSDMNIEFVQKHQNTSYEKAVEILKESHDDVMELIAKFTNQELFENKYFSWTGTTSVGSYCISSTSSHYDWAIKKLKKHKRMCN